MDELERAEIGFDKDGDTQLASAARGFRAVAKQLEDSDPIKVSLIPAVGQTLKGIVEKASEACSYNIGEAEFEIGETVGGWIADICR